MSAQIRMQLNSDEHMSNEIKPFERMFLGNVTGAVIRRRGLNDPHICFELIAEDDGYWFPYTTGGDSSFWLDDYLRVITAVKKWCEEKALPHTGQFTPNPKIAYGWRFKTKEELRKPK